MLYASNLPTFWENFCTKYIGNKRMVFKRGEFPQKTANL